MENSILFQLLILLTAALVLGTIAERLRQSAIIGYLLAGTLVGPNVLMLIHEGAQLEQLAELGVAMLLFTIGLEFSIRRLKQLGMVALIGGSLQVVVTIGVAFGISILFGIAPAGAFALGAMVAMSSTASVLRVLTDRAEVESYYGRGSVGILLLQDAAVIPLTLLVAALAQGGSTLEVVYQIGKTFLFGALLVGVFVLLFNFVVPRLLNIRQWARNRELPILLAMIIAIGSAAGAGQIGLSPAMGAFIAGVLMAASPFAVQVGADVTTLRTLLVTIFFASVGLLADPLWVLEHAWLVATVTLAVIAGKALIIQLILWGLRQPPGMSLASGLCLAQVGEFSFVLLQIARHKLITDNAFALIISVTVLTLLLTPYLVQLAPRASIWLEGVLNPRCRDAVARSQPTAQVPADEKLVLIVGFGPAAQRVAESLIEQYRGRIHVIELNPRNADRAQGYGLSVHIGDAQSEEVLEHAGIARAVTVVITLPDPAASRGVIHQCLRLNPAVHVLARARYHATRWELQMAGAETVIDEEEQMGLRLAEEANRYLRLAVSEDPEPAKE